MSNGYYNLIAPKGFKDVKFNILLPPAKVKGNYFQAIEKSISYISR